MNTGAMSALSHPPKKWSLDQMIGSGIARLFRRGNRSRDSGALLELAQALLSLRGRASGPSLASAFFDHYEAAPLSERQAFLVRLQAQGGPDHDAIALAIAGWAAEPDDRAAAALHDATESPRARLIRMLNLAPGGTRRLIAMRSDLLQITEPSPDLRLLDNEFEAAFANWFNAGFLELRRIDWNSSAAVLERLIAYEAVHSLAGWDDLRRRLEPADRRCYAFFHPQMADDPLIFVEVALTRDLPSAIAPIIGEETPAVSPHTATCAIFYSISNCQAGLRGIPFGNFLIKQVVSLLSRELPQLRVFATLSPVPGFARWLAVQADQPATGDAEELRRQCALYITTGRDGRGQVLDPVARFHLGNGARLEAVHAGADLSDKGMRQSHGVMVNYLYDLTMIETNHLRLFEGGEVVVGPQIEELLKPKRTRKRMGETSPRA